MVHACVVPNCPSLGKQYCKMHVFPKDPQLFKKWIAAINREDLAAMDMEKVRKNRRVCCMHFPNKLYFNNNANRTNLKHGAVPIVNLCLPKGFRYEQKHYSFLMNEEHETETHQQLVPDYTMATLPVVSQIVHEDTVPSTPLDCLPGPSNSIEAETSKSARPQRIKKDYILKVANITRKKYLSPTERKLYRLASLYKRSAERYRKLSNHRRITKAVQFSMTQAFLKSSLNPTTYKFLMSQVKQQSRDPRGRRYELEDKIYALTLFKQGPKCYRLLRKTFALPSRKTMRDLLNQIPFDTGVNPHLMEALKEEVQEMEQLDRYCCLLFDEMSLEPGLAYNSYADAIDGFVDCGMGKKTNIADHAMVFMLRGLRRKWKQPIAYYFSENGMLAADLKRNITEIVNACQSIGLHVIATVCDQMSANCRALAMLQEESRRVALRKGEEYNKFGFVINNDELFPLYDPPHLLKGLRNNFMKYNVTFEMNGKMHKASFGDIQKLYELDVGDYDTKMLNHLTDAHVYEDRMKKMNVRLAAQVMSRRVGSILLGFSRIAPEKLSATASGTAEFVLFVDRLFDSVNASRVRPEKGKVLRCGVRSGSPHHQFWMEARKVLQSMKFWTSPTKCFVPPTVKNWIKTIEGFGELSKRLQGFGISFFLTRHANQDPLENFFGGIRMHGARNINPTCTSFRFSYRTLILNNYTSKHSPSANCEKDDCEPFIQSVKRLLAKRHSVQDVDDTAADIEEVMFRTNPTKMATQQHAYIAGYLARKILNTVQCKSCKRDLLTEVQLEEHQLIEFRRYSKNSLLRPNTTFIQLYGVSVLLCIIHYHILQTKGELELD